MGRLTIVMITGLVWAIISFLVGCAQTQEWLYPKTETQNEKIEQLTARLEFQNKKIEQLTARLEFQYKKIKQLTAKFEKSQQANLALNKENISLKIDKSRMMNSNSKLKKHNLELTMKIDMLKILDHRVEEKRKNYFSE
jgi:division protein CdvB (Snf7/Vps24/ESCRT-III family)